jgi:hypothetical protein
MRTRREVGAKSAAGEPAVRHTAEGSATLMRLALRLFRGNRTSVSADCRRLDHGKIATVRLGGLSRNRLSPRRRTCGGRCTTPVRRSVLAPTLAVQEGPRVTRNWTRRLPGSQAFVREALQTAAGSSILKLRSAVSSGFCATTTGAMAIYSTLIPKYLAERCRACAAPTGGLRCPPSAESRG